MKIPAIIEHKDGTRETFDWVGGRHWIRCEVQPGGRIEEATYTYHRVEHDADCKPECDVCAPIFRETERRDMTARMRESAERMRLQSFRDLGVTPPAPLDGGKGMLPGETAEERERRFRIQNGEEP